MATQASLQATAPRSHWIHSSRLHVVLYSCLLVATPFIMLRRFLQEAVGTLSRVHFPFLGVEVAVVPLVAGVVVAALLVAFRRRLTPLRLAAGGIGILMIVLGQRMTDYYFNHRFYDLQQNWHYLAYGTFSVMMFLDLAPRGIPLGRILALTFGWALFFSTFDETFQLRLSRRIFDPSDIAKDAYGSVIGMALLTMGENRYGAMLRNLGPLRHRSLRGYLDHPFSTWLLLFVFALFLLVYGSLLSEAVYLPYVALFSIGSFAGFFALLHLSQFRWGGRLILLGAVALAVALGATYVRHRDDGVGPTRPRWTSYRGIPIPFFDVLFLPDGGFRLVDKKVSFNQRDRLFLLSKKTDILLVGTGTDGLGGRGFPEDGVHQFNYNRSLERGTQVIRLPNEAACALYNRLRAEGKSILFVLHQGASR